LFASMGRHPPRTASCTEAGRRSMTRRLDAVGPSGDGGACSCGTARASSASTLVSFEVAEDCPAKRVGYNATAAAAAATNVDITIRWTSNDFRDFERTLCMATRRNHKTTD